MNIKLKTEILEKIKTTQKEDLIIKNKVKKFIDEIEHSRKKLKIDCDFFVGGSFGKGTYLKNNFDVDIFCRFNDSKNISLKLEKILKKSKKKIFKQKGSRDYFQIYENNIKFEIIPIKKIKSIKFAENTTDHSPLHVDFILSEIKKNKTLADEIRLSKQFFKANKLYGAESYIGGFSGHVIDLLVLYYGSFNNMIKEISFWKFNTIVDVTNYYKTQKELLFKIQKDKHSNLILVDPILKNRNAARALNLENYSRAILIAHQKFGKFKKKDFLIKKIKLSKQEEKASKFAKKNNLKKIIYKFSIRSEVQSNDIVGSKLLKLKERIENYFESYDFIISSSQFNLSFDEMSCHIYLFFEKTQLSTLKKVIGPKVTMKNDIEKFLKNKKNHFILNDRVCAYEKRKITQIDKIMKLNKKKFEKLLGKKLNFINKIKITK